MEILDFEQMNCNNEIHFWDAHCWESLPNRKVQRRLSPPPGCAEQKDKREQMQTGKQEIPTQYKELSDPGAGCTIPVLGDIENLVGQGVDYLL